MTMYIRLSPPYLWLRTNEDDDTTPASFGEAPALSDYLNSEDERLIAIVDGKSISTHKVESPAKNRKQFQAALPFLLEESLTEAIEDMHFCPLEWKADAATTVMVASKTDMDWWQQQAADNNLRPSIMLPDYMLLPLHSSSDYSLALVDDEVLVRGKDGSGARFSRDMLALWLPSIPPRSIVAINNKALTEELIRDGSLENATYWNFGTRIQEWLQADPGLEKNLHGFNLLRGEYTPLSKSENRRLLWKRAAALIVVAASIVLLSRVAVHARLYIHHNRIDSSMAEIIQSRVPELTSVVRGSERQLLEGILSRGNVASDRVEFTRVLAQIAPALRSNRATIESIIYRNQQITIACKLTDLTSVDRLLSALNSIQRLNASLQSSSSDTDGTSARYRIDIQS